MIWQGETVEVHGVRRVAGGTPEWSELMGMDAWRSQSEFGVNVVCVVIVTDRWFDYRYIRITLSVFVSSRGGLTVGFGEGCVSTA